MNPYLYFSFISTIYTVFLIIVFFSKKRVNSDENRIFKHILNTTIICCVVEILQLFVKNIFGYGIILELFCKLFISLEGLWVTLFFIYTLTITSKDVEEFRRLSKRIKKITYIGSVISFIVMFTLPIKYYVDESTNAFLYTYGPSINFLYAFVTVLLILSTISLIANHKNMFTKKYIPLFVYLIITIVELVVQKINPAFLIATSLQTFVAFLMFHTIENPDLKMIEQLEIAKDQADKANNAKSDFLSNMSHEIRTPLNAIVGFSETLKDEDIPESARENVEDIIMASNNLLDIVNGILDISKIEANKLEIIDKEYDIKSVLDELTALTKARIGERGLDFRVNIDPSLPRVLYGDNVRLKQVILNILTNAVKYTKEGYVIFTVSSVIKNDICRLIISVEDSGIGIKEESIPKLFSKFERLDVEKEITIEGTGLGLAITKKLVELMHGTIIVQSVYGKGSKFTISIDQKVISNEPREIKSSPFTESKIVDAHGAKVLIVDDNALNIKVAGVLLRKYHFTIDEAISGYECIDKIANGEKYDIIFLDDMMPKMSGKETLKKLKKLPDFNIPVIALTANAITGMKQEYLNAGFDDYLSKPIEKQELERVIKEYLNKMSSKSTNTSYSANPNSILNKTMTINIPKLASTKDSIEKKKVLLVDDNDLNIKVALASLKHFENLDVTTVNSGHSAIEKVIENKYDLILLDEMMPELDGCATLDNFKSLEDFTTPVIMMTASPRDEVESKLEEHGFSGYLSKPFKKEDLEEIINDILN